MTSFHDPENPTVGAYLLDALEPEEAAAFEAHLIECLECRAEVAELGPVVHLLPLAVDLVEPPAELRDQILRAIAEPPARPALHSVVGGLASPAPRAARRWRPEFVVGLAAAVVLLLLGGWNLQMHQQLNQRPTAASGYDHIVALAVSRGALVTPVTGQGTARATRAVLIQPVQGHAYFVEQGLPATSHHRVYELWLMRNGSAWGVGVFSAGTTGPAVVHLPQSARGWALTGVTVEPGPNGSTRPTSTPIMVGKLIA